MNPRARQPIAASAPVRLDFAGGWTDVAPFTDHACGVVVNAAIELRTRVELTLNHRAYELAADDLGDWCTGATLDEIAHNGILDLPRAAVRRAGLGPCLLRTFAAAPPGSGLGTSGALSVALIRACSAAGDDTLTPAETAEAAWELETIDAAVAGGKQDQFAAALGGFNLLAFDRNGSEVTPLAVEPAFADTLARHLVLCYTGRSRFSGSTISRVMAAYSAGDQTVAGALHGMVDCAWAMAEALTASDLVAVGRTLHANWLHQQQLDAGMCTAEMARLESAMQRSGAVGGKAAGSGAGGSMFFVVPDDPAPAIAAARDAGATVLPVDWAREGVRLD